MSTHEQKQPRASTRVLLAAALVLAVVGLAGCRTAVYQQGDRAADSSRTAALEVQTQSQTLEAAMATLNNLVCQPATDLKPQFHSFSAAMDRLVAAAGRGGVTGSHLVRSNSAYFAAWNNQLTTITNAEVRSRNEARRTEVSNQFNAVHQQYAQAQGDLWSLVDYLQDIRRALSTDLTAGGVEAVKPLVSTASANASKVQSGLTQSRANLSALSTAMSSAGGPGG
jgi:hypothetical protein